MKILDFYADWCGPCKMMKPVIEALVDEGYDVEKIDIDSNGGREKAQEYSVMSIPTIIILDGDEEVQRFNGFTSKDKIIGVVAQLV